MSIEATLVCDRCSTVIAGGAREQMVNELLENGGAALRNYHALDTDRTGEWTPTTIHPWMDSRRHLCPHCTAERPTSCGDGAPIKWPPEWSAVLDRLARHTA